MEKIRLTQFSKAAGCGCKIAPQLLDIILQQSVAGFHSPQLLVGNETKDDAAVYDLGNGTALISTTDFFTPIVDDAYDFGMAAAANAISDIYAMGGKPIMALAILGFPVDLLAPEIAQQILEGGRAMCNKAGIPLAGGHTISAQEPIFGLSVNGLVQIEHLKKNNTAQEGDILFLTKPIGTGILSTAQKRGELKEADYEALKNNLHTLNSIGFELGKTAGVHAITDVTGFGLLGHLIEVCEGSNVSAELFYSKIPMLASVKEYLAKKMIPDATYRNWNAYGTKVSFETGVNVMEAFSLLPDPQTNGGLLIAVAASSVKEVMELLAKENLYSESIGRIISKEEKLISCKI